MERDVHLESSARPSEASLPESYGPLRRITMSPSPRPLSVLLLSVLVPACGGGGGASSQASIVSPTTSDVAVPVATGLVSDGASQAVVEIALRDADGLPVANAPVTLAATGAQNHFWPSAQLVTDANGRAQAALTATSPGQRVVTVSAGPSGQPGTVLEDKPVVDFQEPAAPRKRVSVSSAGEEAESFSGHAAAAGFGHYVAFMSKAANLVPGDTNEKEDVFVHDLATGATQRVSLKPSGGQFADLAGRPSLSDDGSLVAFQARDTEDDEVYVRDRLLGLTEPISEAAGLDGKSFDPALSGDGRFVAFVHHDGESQQVYVFDRLGLALELVSQSSGGAQGDDPSYAPSISRDGRYVAFASTADNLVAGDSNDKDDVFVRDRLAGTTVRVSVSSGGGEGNDDSAEASIAADGRYVAFASKAENLVQDDDNGKSDVFVRDMLTGVTERISLNPQGGEVDKESWQPDLSADGNFVVFASLSDDLVSDDTNGKQDIFRRDRALGVTVRVSLAFGGGDPDQDSWGPALASDAALVAFTSKADNLVPSDENDTEDVFSAPRD